MNIVSVKNNSGQQDYILKEDDKTVLKLSYKKDLHTARIETETERRVLFMDDEGLLKSKLVLKNEYGVRIGSLSYDNFSDTHGSVEIENTKFRFLIEHNGNAPALHIYKGSRRNEIYKCRLSFVDISSKELKYQPSAFTIALSWFLSLQGMVEGKPALNDAIIS